MRHSPPYHTIPHLPILTITHHTLLFHTIPYYHTYPRHPTKDPRAASAQRKSKTESAISTRVTLIRFLMQTHKPAYFSISNFLYQSGFAKSWIFGKWSKQDDAKQWKLFLANIFLCKDCSPEDSNFTWKARKAFQSCARRGLVLLQRRPFGPVLGRPFVPFGPMCKVHFVIAIAVCASWVASLSLQSCCFRRSEYDQEVGRI